MYRVIISTPFRVRLLAVALLGGSALLLIAARTPPPSPVYSVATVRAGLIRSPGGWVGRTIHVRAVAGVCTTWLGSMATSSCQDRLPAYRQCGVNATVQSMPTSSCLDWQPGLLSPGPVRLRSTYRSK